MCSGFVGTKKPVQEVITAGLCARELDRGVALMRQAGVYSEVTHCRLKAEVINKF